MRSRSVSVLWVVAVIVALASCVPAAEDTTEVRVMTQDLAIGADLDAVLEASPESLPVLVDAMWAEQERSSFAARVGKIADAIVAYAPDLVGVQSAIQWRRQAPASSAPADEVVSDYLELLLTALAARGAPYQPVSIAPSADLELTGASGNDYRFSDREVILARQGLATSGATSGTYNARRLIAIGNLSIEYRRGWASVQAEKGGKAFRFVSTHLEAVDPAVQRDQATELVAVLAADGAATVVVGDLASDPARPLWPAYTLMTARGTGLSDPVSSAGAGFPTCCRDPALVDPSALLDRRVDVVLSTSHFNPSWGAWSLGNATGMVDGLWPSSHAGVIASVNLK